MGRLRRAALRAVAGGRRTQCVVAPALVASCLRGLSLRYRHRIRFPIVAGHADLTPLLGRSVTGGNFEIVWTAPEPVKPDPYLVRFEVARFLAQLDAPADLPGRRARPRLKVVKP